MNKCAIIPKVRNRKGEIVDSKLFRDLLSFTSNNRKAAVNAYLITKSSDFIRDWESKLTLDENNEPTIRSLIKEVNLNDIISESKILDKLNKEIGYYKRGTTEPNFQVLDNTTYREAKQKAISFNRNSEFSDEYVANVVKKWDEQAHKEYVGVKVEKRNRTNSANAERMEYNEVLNQRLIEILASHGVSVGALTALEERMGIHGVTDFSVAKNAAQGLVELIRLAKGIEGKKALPEEFAHFAIEAMGSNSLINRLLNYIASNDLIEEIIGEDFDTYNTLYHGDKAKLAKEAAGKLLAKHLLQNAEIPSRPYKNLLQRVIQAVKNFFKNINASPIQKAMREADKSFGSLARQILDGSLDDAINIDNIKSEQLFYSTTERVERDKKLLQDIIKNELKRLDIYSRRNPNEAFGERQSGFINKLQRNLAENNEIEGIYTFLESALEELDKTKKRLAILESSTTATVNEKAGVFRNIRNYYYSYKHIVDDIRESLLDEEKYEDNRYGNRVRVALDNTSTLLDDLYISYMKSSMPHVVQFAKSFIGEGITVPLGKFKGKTITAEDLVQRADRDITFFDRWLDSMADSSDYMLKIMDQAVKKSKENARLDTIEISKRLQAATVRLEQAGVRDTDWMFERDDEGNLTGRYISEINMGLYNKRREEMEKSLKDKYGEFPAGENARKYKEERKAWFSANTEHTEEGKWRPKKSIYGNKVFESLNEAQKVYYKEVMSIKEQLDSYLPEHYTSLYNTVKIRKDLIERVKNSDSVISGAKQVWESVKDQFIRRSDDEFFGDRATLTDFEGREVQLLPIYYTKMKKGENPNDISTDITSTLTAYAAMANDYHEMNKVINVLELARDILREREITQTRGGRSLKEIIRANGMEAENTLTKKGDKTRFMQRLNDFFEMQVYERYMADEGTFGNTKIDKAQVANFVNTMSALNTMAINLLSGISNVATGTIMMRIESLAKEFFSESDTLIADREYIHAMQEFLGEIGNRVHVSKLALWNELFDVMQEYKTDIRELNFDRKTWFSRGFKTSTMFFINNAGEHWMQTRTSLALANTYKMKSPDGRIVSLWDAMEVVPIDKNNKKLGARLQLKEGYTKADGTEFTRSDIIAFSRKSAAINQRMHGIYNYADRNAFQRLAIGRMAMIYRKWMRPSYNRRFRGVTYNFDLQAWTEGYYVTLGRFLTQAAKEIKESQFDLVANWKKLTPTEKANIKRAATELTHFIAIALLLGLISWPDDDDRSWASTMAEYQLRRLYTEIGVMTPGPQFLGEGLRILKSPAAGVNILENTLDLIGLVNPFNYELFGGEDALIKSGRYKGHNKAYRLFFESPVIPMNKTIYRVLHPEEGIPFYKQ